MVIEIQYINITFLVIGILFLVLNRFEKVSEKFIYFQAIIGSMLLSYIHKDNFIALFFNVFLLTFCLTILLKSFKLAKIQSFLESMLLVSVLSFFLIIASILGVAVIRTSLANYKDSIGSGYYSNNSNNKTEDYDIHHVDPHYVNGYYRRDGTYVSGYWRGGSTGYYRSDPH